MSVRNPKARRAYSLVELLVYCSVLIAILTLAYTSLTRFWTASARMRAHADDLRAVLDAGEQWRADIRTPGARISASERDGEQVIVINTGEDRAIEWAFLAGSILRRESPTSPWNTRLSQVKVSRMELADRGALRQWHWDVELEPRSLKHRFRRPFTFVAVPTTPLKP